MCGIAGVINAEAPGLVRSMVDKIAHRGPDNAGIENFPKASLGFCRLSIIDLSPKANQPLLDEDNKICMIFNGEIYNYIELKNQLKHDFLFETSSDSEVFLKSYLKWGTKCFEKINGMFAVCFYHTDTHQAILARDRFGQKPLFYHQDGESFIFASEIKALLLKAKAKSNPEAWTKYLSTGIYDDNEQTFFKNIYQLKPSTYLKIKDNTLTEVEYYNISKTKRDYSIKYQEAKEEIFRLIQDAIKIHTRSDVPYCLSLSSGFDSSAILASLDYQNLSKNKLKCFTLDFEDALSESELAKEFSKNWRFEHIVHTLKEESANLLNECIYHQESPLGGLLNLGQHFNFKKIHSQGFKVCLDGAGVDEVFCGYLALLKKYKNKKELNTKTQIDGTYSNNKKFLLNNHNEETKNISNLLEAQFDYLKRSKLNRGLRMKDRYSMHHSVELRVPFIDHKLVEFGLSLNPDFYFKEGTKYIIRDSMSKIMPKKTCFAPKKSINSPQTKWLQRPHWLETTKEIINSDSFHSRRLLNTELIKKSHENFELRDVKNSFYVWQWINMELWHRIFIDS